MDQTVVVTAGKMLAVLGLVAANGFFVAAEFSLVGVRRTRIEELVSEGSGTARLLHRAVTHLDDSLAATQLGVIVSSLALGWIGEAALAGVLEPALALLAALALITVFHIVLGELVPKSLALQIAPSAPRPGASRSPGWTAAASTRSRSARRTGDVPRSREGVRQNGRP